MSRPVSSQTERASGWPHSAPNDDFAFSPLRVPLRLSGQSQGGAASLESAVCSGHARQTAGVSAILAQRVFENLSPAGFYCFGILKGEGGFYQSLTWH